MSNSIFQQLDFNDFAKDSKEIDIDIFDIEKFGIIKVYENEGQPALFLKEVLVKKKIFLPFFLQWSITSKAPSINVLPQYRVPSKSKTTVSIS